MAVGIHVGAAYINYSGYDLEGEREQFQGFDEKFSYQGFSLSFGNKLRFSNSTDKYGLFFEHRYNNSWQDYGIIGDGVVTHKLNYHSLSLGVHYRFGGSNK